MSGARAVISDGTGGFAVQEIDVGDPGPGEVLVELAASGVCHTDLQLAETVPLPMILGHEGAGTVVAAGDGVTRVAVGDRVLLTWAIACGTCFITSSCNTMIYGESPDGLNSRGSPWAIANFLRNNAIFPCNPRIVPAMLHFPADPAWRPTRHRSMRRNR